MPGFTTHYILGMKAFNDLPSNPLKHIISKYRWLYQLGLQGPDMFFYNIPILRHRDYRNVGSYMHEHHVNLFFDVYLNSSGNRPWHISAAISAITSETPSATPTSTGVFSMT